MDNLWLDEGPASQGRLITTMLRKQDAIAAGLLRRWSKGDLLELGSACERLAALAAKEMAGR